MPATGAARPAVDLAAQLSYTHSRSPIAVARLRRQTVTRKPALLLFLLLVPALTGFSSAPAEEPGSLIDVPLLEIEHYVLPNGLDVILQPDASQPEVAVNVWYHVGSRNETPGRHGFAHVFEHLMFKGSGHHPDDFIPAIQALGGRTNGLTDKDRTTYWATVPPQHLEFALWLEADRMGFAMDVLDEDKLQKQISVVLNELARNADKPYDGADAALTALMFPPGHPYSWTVGGDPAELAAATLEDVADYFRSYYVPNNASLCVAGCFDPAQARAWIDEYFGTLPTGPAQQRLTAWTPRIDGERRAVLEDDVNLPRLYWSWHTPARYRPGDSECDVLAGVLGGAGSSRLRRALMYDRSLAQDLRVRQRSRELGSTFEIEITAAPGVDLAEIEAVLGEVLEQVREQGITEGELQAARAGLEADFLRGLQRLDGFGGPANLLNRYNLFLGDPGWLENDLKRIRDCSLESTQQTARAWLGPRQRAVLHVVPAAGGEVEAGEVDRSLAPSAGPAIEFKPPSIGTGTLANGLRYHWVQQPKLPLVEAHLNLRGGWAADGDRPGLCSLTTEMLDEGAAGRSALQIAAAADALGAELECESNFDATWVRLNVPGAGLDAGLALLADVALRPDFPTGAFGRIVDEFRGRLELEQARPRTRAIEDLQLRMFGAAHPYSRPYTGSVAAGSLDALSIADLRGFHDAWFRPGNAELVLVGDLDADRARRLATKYFGHWQDRAGGAGLPTAAAPVTSGPGLVVLDRPGSKQATLIGGLVTVGRSSELRKPLQMLNLVLGGDYSSRINQKLRAEKGITYGARTRLINYRQAGFFLIDATVQTDAAGESIADIVGAMTGLAGDAPPTAAELDHAQASLTQGFVRSFSTLERAAEELDRILVCGLPLDEWETAQEAYAQAAARNLSEVAADQLDPSLLTWVVVGDWEVMRPGFEKHGLRPLEVTPF